MKVIDSMWFSTMQGNFGLVVGENEMGARRIYAGVVSGLDQKADEQAILDWGNKLKAIDLKQRKRDKNVAEARQVAMYLLWKTDKYTLLVIGRAMGGRSPATVSHAFNTIATRISREPELQDRVTKIQRLLVGE